MRILMVTDAWYPQVNGVVTTLDRVSGELSALGHEICLVTHEGRRTFALPTYPEIRLALARPKSIAGQIERFAPDCIHIATEGTLGWIARRHCLKRGLAFTTSFHSRFPEMIAERLPLPGVERMAYRVLRRFHAPARATLAPTATVTRRLTELGFSDVVTWTRGVDCDRFGPRNTDPFGGLARPICLNVGRVAVEKNLAAFLDLDLPGSKVVVGDGPQLPELRRQYPEVTFTGYRTGEPLVEALAAADVFVFPSCTDTFGLVMLEALACGVPVAAFPVEGPIDVITSDKVGALDYDLKAAIGRALLCRPADCIAFAAAFSWARCAEMLESCLTPARPGNRA
ncbi:MAG: glycosyltransferase family 4 protein [Hyphomicrobiales bacterium]